MVRKIYLKIRKPLCILLGFALAAGVWLGALSAINSASAVSESNYNTEWQPPVSDPRADEGGYQLSAQNDALALFVDYETGGFYVENKADGFCWYSTPQDTESDTISKGVAKMETQSELLLEYIAVEDVNKNSNTQKVNSKIGCQQNGLISVSDIDNGVRVIYDFKQQEIRIPVEYVLTKDSVQASIIADEIEDGSKTNLITVQLLPFFGAAGADKEGYLFIPDGSGAVSEFNNGVIPMQEYRKTVYGSDRAYYSNNETAKNENILMPVFGTVYDSGAALMGIITEGESGAAISVETGNAKNYYNTVYAEMCYRIYSVGQSLYTTTADGKKDISTVTHTPFGAERFTVEYSFLTGEKATYSGMAERYRKYLREIKGLKKEPEEPALALDVYGALATKTNTFGILHDKLRVLTDFEETRKIIEKLENGGVDNFAVRLNGWSNNGVFNKVIPGKAKPLKLLGGSKKFNSLSEYLAEKQYEFYPEVDLITYSKGGSGFSKRGDSAKSTNGDIAWQYVYSIVTFEESGQYEPWMLLKPSLLTKAFDAFYDNYRDLDISSLSISGIGEYLYSDFSKKNGIYKAKAVSYAEEMLQKASEKLSDIAVSGGNAYAVPYVDRIYSLPISSSGYDIFEYDVPFVQMVLHGYVSYTTPYVAQSHDTNFVLLKSLETGSDLLFSCVGDDSYPLAETRLSHLFSSESSLWSDKAAEYYKINKSVSDMVWKQAISNHQCIEKDLFKTEYENGITVYVNYSSEDKQAENIDVPAMGYAIGEVSE